VITATKIERNGTTTWMHLQVKGAQYPTQLGLHDGVIESYMAVLNLSDPADVVVLLIIDSLVEDIDSQIPYMDDPEAAHKVQVMLRRYSKKFDWNGLRDELVAEATISDEETSRKLREMWSAQRDFFIANPEAEMGPVDALYLARQKMAKAQEITERERLADKMVAGLSKDLRSQPRDLSVNSVGFTVEI
jgi:hypothetical protein